MTESKSTAADERTLELATAVLRDLSTSAHSDRIAELSEALENDLSPPVVAHAANILAHHRFQTRDYDGALSACCRWIDAAPEEPAAVTSVLSILVRMNRFEDVVAIANDRLSDDPENFPRVLNIYSTAPFLRPRPTPIPFPVAAPLTRSGWCSRSP